MGDLAHIDARFAEAEAKSSELRRRWEAQQWDLLRRQMSSPVPALGFAIMVRLSAPI
jgi:hypothetical protein